MDMWVSSSAFSPIPPMAVVGGHDVDQSPIYVGRSFYEGDCLPAKLVPSKRTAFVCWGGQEIPRSEYEVLTGPGYGWVGSAGGMIPPNAVKGGNTRSGETLYIGRANHQGSLCVGKVQPSHGCLYIPFGGQEVRINNYEILILGGQQHNWIPTTAAYTPPDAVVAGHDLDRTVLYVGRAQHEELKWVHSSTRSAIPPKAVIGGNDVNGDVIYVGRVSHNGNLLPVKVIPAKHMAYTSWCGEEICKEHYEVLCSQKCKWKQCYNHVIPENAVAVGSNNLAKPVFIGRGHYQGSLTVGRVSSVHRSLFIPFNGVEHRLESYEILVLEYNNNSNSAWQHEDKPPFAITPVMPFPQPSAPPANFYNPPGPPPQCVMPPRPIYPSIQPAENFRPTMPMPGPNAMFNPPGPYGPQGHSQHTWVGSNGSFVPPNAVIGGHDIDMSVLYVCRAQHEGNFIPGKFPLKHGQAYVCAHSREIGKKNFDILINAEKYHWVTVEDKRLPPGAVCAGYSRKGKPLFVGRGTHYASLTPGYIKYPKCNKLIISFDGGKHKIHRFEALVLSSDFYQGKYFQ